MEWEELCQRLDMLCKASATVGLSNRVSFTPDDRFWHGATDDGQIARFLVICKHSGVRVFMCTCHTLTSHAHAHESAMRTLVTAEVATAASDAPMGHYARGSFASSQKGLEGLQHRQKNSLRLAQKNSLRLDEKKPKQS